MIYDITLTVVDSTTSTTYSGAAISIQTEKVVGQVNTGDGGGITDGDKGDITVSAGGATWTIDAGAVTAGKLASNSVTAAKIADGNVTTDKLADRSVTAAKLFQVGATKLLGRHTGTAGDVQEISVDGGLEFHGGQLRRAALTGPVTASAGGNTTVLAQNGAATGNYYKWDGTSWVPAVISYLEDIEDIPATFTPAAHTHTLSNLTQSGATTNQIIQWNGTNWVPATASAGKIINYWVATTTTTGSTTNILPIDDTVPQSSEGAEFMTVSVTPSSASNKLKVTVSGWYRVSGASFVGCALFVGSAASASASRVLLASNVVVSPFDLVFWIDSFSGTETLSFRMGTDRNTVTLQFLNSSASTYFSTTDPAMILVEEYTV